jgi:monoamine oxidase
LDADVCVIGAGYAGLTAARRIAQAGRSVLVLEARDRVGGRVWTRVADDGTPFDIGGTWDAVRAHAWDARSAGQWIEATYNVPTREARALLGAAIRGLFTSDPSEVSLLHALYRSANGLTRLLATEGGYQQDHVTGGAQSIAIRVAAELDDRSYSAPPCAWCRRTRRE